MSNYSVINKNFAIFSLSSKTGNVKVTTGNKVKQTIRAKAMVKEEEKKWWRGRKKGTTANELTCTHNTRPLIMCIYYLVARFWYRSFCVCFFSVFLFLLIFISFILRLFHLSSHTLYYVLYVSRHRCSSIYRVLLPCLFYINFIAYYLKVDKCPIIMVFGCAINLFQKQWRAYKNGRKRNTR